jgi:hypothetical protein
VQAQAERRRILRVLTLGVGCAALVWGISIFFGGASADFFRDVETYLLRFEAYNPSATNRMLADTAVQDVSDCDDHSQRALLLLEMRLTEAALRSGASQEYDQHMRALEARTRRALSCSPRDSFAWLMAFGLQVQHGALNEHAFDLLAMSYETSPNEAWIAVRRIMVAAPVALSAPEPVKRAILAEFQNLVRHHFVEVPARVYFNAPASLQALLRSRIDELDPPSQRAFSDALEKLRT